MKKTKVLYKGYFLDADGNIVDGKKVVSPLFAEDNNKIVFLGTAFFITVNGLMLTAKHCLFKKDKPYDKLFIIQFLDNNKYVIRQIFQSRWNISDIAVLLPFNYSSKSNEKLLLNPKLTLTTKKQNIGEIIGSYAYPNSTVFNNDPKRIIKMRDSYHF